MISLMILPLIALLIPMIGTHPYLDPGSGSFILQILIATIVGSLFLVKVYWNKLKAFFKRTPTDTPVGEDKAENKQEQE
jgi:hypothetical protein